MSGLFGSLSIAKRGLIAHRIGMDVIGNNIANANTEGYTRQRVNLTPFSAKFDNGHNVGQGVEVQSIIRTRDNLIDKQVRYTESKLGYSNTQAFYFGQVEGLFPEPSDYGLQSLMSDFFTELRNVSNNPKNLAVRNTFLQSSLSLTKGFNDTVSSLNKLGKDIAEDVDEKVLNVNSLLKEIHTLNTTIAIEKGVNLGANELLDQRDLKIDRLSKLIDIEILPGEDGVSHITSNGISLVRKNSYASLSKQIEDIDGKETLSVIVNKTGKVLPLKNGEIQGGVDVWNDEMPEVHSRLNNIAIGLIGEFNQLHRASFSLSTDGSPVETGRDFFQGNSAGSISVNKVIQEDIKKIAVSTNGEPGNSEGALSMLNLEQAAIVDEDYTLYEYYGALLTDVGLDRNNAVVFAEANEASLATFKGDRDSVSGVSIDEELANLIRVQRSYESSAKVVSTIDRMMDTIMNLKS